MRSGFFNLTVSGTFGAAGATGYSWSSFTLAATTNANDLTFNTTTIPSASGYRYVGRPLRCLSTVIDI